MKQNKNKTIEYSGDNTTPSFRLRRLELHAMELSWNRCSAQGGFASFIGCQGLTARLRDPCDLHDPCLPRSLPRVLLAPGRASARSLAPSGCDVPSSHARRRRQRPSRARACASDPAPASPPSARSPSPDPALAPDAIFPPAHVGTIAGVQLSSSEVTVSSQHTPNA